MPEPSPPERDGFARLYAAALAVEFLFCLLLLWFSGAFRG